MKNLKITLTSWAPFIGGAEVAVERLALGLSAAGHDVLLVVGTDGEALSRFRRAGIRCEYVPQRFTSKLKWLQYRKSRNMLVDLLRREQPDIVHSNDLPTHQMTSDAALKAGVPCVCHHRWIFEQAAIDWLNKYSANRHLFVSQALMDMLCGESKRLADSPRSVVYDGLPIPPRPTPEARLAARTGLATCNLQLATDTTLILFAGQIIERKGVADLLHAWDQLPKASHDSAELVIVGDDLENNGAYRREMEQLAKELKHPVRFMGFQKKVPRWLTAADIVLVPSHAEPLGNATLEAMSFCRPVIGCRVGGIPEMVVHEETGLLVEAKSPANLAVAIQTLLTDPPLRERLGQAARQRCEQLFSIEAHVNAVLEQYDAVLSS